MGQQIVVADAFASEPFTGNPAAVCLLERPAAEPWMQLVAAEMNLSETAFLYPIEGGFHLRWFTPATEVDLCGHATLASAHVLWESGVLHPGDEARFETRSGWLTVRQSEGMLEMDLPASPVEPCTPPGGLFEALHLDAAPVYRTRFDYLVESPSEEAVCALEPEHVLLRKLPVRGVMVTAPATRPGVDFVSRFFAPGSGIDEDPVTGSAHCALGPFWAARLNKPELMAWQVSKRGGSLRVRVDGNGERVSLGGHAVTVLRGELTMPAGPAATSR